MKPPIVIGYMGHTYTTAQSHKKQVEEQVAKEHIEVNSYQVYKTGQELRRERRKNKRNAIK